MKGLYGFHKFIYAVSVLPVRLFCRLKFRLQPGKRPQVKGPCLIVANHNTDYDFLFVGTTFLRHTYFVGTDHIYRGNFSAKLLYFFLGPIARRKGTTDTAAAVMTLRTLREGKSVCIFAEGNRSFNGLTTPVHPTIGKLAKTSKANLVIYRLEGGYFASPRWSTKLRRGRIRCVLQHVYTPEELQNMTPSEVQAAVERHIHEDAYALQDKCHERYTGRRRAEGIERVLCLCPVCGGIDTIRGAENAFFCSACGLSGSYSEYGYLEGDKLPYRTITEWDSWQDGELKKLVQGEKELLFADDAVVMVSDGEKPERYAGRMVLERERLTVGDKTFSVKEIRELAMFRADSFLFSAEGKSWELRGNLHTNFRKYLRTIELLQGAELTI